MATVVNDVSAFRFGPGHSQSSDLEMVAGCTYSDDLDTGDLIQVADAINRDVDGDGVLVLWSPDDGDPGILYKTGVCDFDTDDTDSYVATTLTVPRPGGGGTRTNWRTLADGMSGMLIAVFPIKDGTVFVSVVFAQLERTTRMQAVENIARLMPFVHPFVVGWATRLALATSVRNLTAAIDGIGMGIVLVDDEGHVILVNNAASRLIAAGDGLRHRGQMLAGGGVGDTARLHAAIDQAIAPVQGHKGIAKLTLPLKRRGTGPLIASVIATGQTAVFGNAAAAVICVVDPDLDIRTLVARISEIYGMSRVETRLASELAMGKSLIEAAGCLRIREGTARSYLKQLFLKTGTHRQVELVRLLIAGAAAVSLRPAPASA